MDATQLTIDLLIEHAFKKDLRKKSCIGLDAGKFLIDEIHEIKRTGGLNFWKYGQFTNICQSDGFGKTKACCSLVNQNCYLVYCSLRDKNSLGYPKRSCLADLFLEEDTPEQLKKKFIAYQNAFIEILNGKEESIQCDEFFKTYEQREDNFFVRDVVLKKIQEAKDNDMLYDYINRRWLIFVFDDLAAFFRSRSTETNFHILRSVLDNGNSKVFTIFVDHNVELGNDNLNIFFKVQNKTVEKSKKLIIKFLFVRRLSANLFWKKLKNLD
jgi:hypothetical protein